MWLRYTYTSPACGVQDTVLFHSALKHKDTKTVFCVSESFNLGSLTVSVEFTLLMCAVMLRYLTEIGMLGSFDDIEACLWQ